MRRILLFSLLTMLVYSCKDDDGPTGTTAYPTESLTTSPVTNSLLLLEYNSSSSTIAVAEGVRASIAKNYGGGLTHMALPSSAGDKLHVPMADSLSDHFGGAPTPSFLLNGLVVNVATAADIQAAMDEIDLNLNTKPLLAVAHAASENDTAYICDVKIRFYDDTISNLFYVETYLLGDITAKNFPNKDLRLTPSGLVVNSDGETTVWTNDFNSPLDTTLVYSKNSNYVHKNVFMANFNKDNVFGTGLHEYTKFGPEFFNGDIIGLRQNPIRHYFNKADFKNLDYTFSPHFLTVVWNYDFVNLKYVYVNSYMN